MKSILWIAAVALVSVPACNSTVGECWPVGQSDGSAGVGGGGVIVPSGAGGLGDAPQESGTAGPACNSTPQEPAAPQMPADNYINCQARGLDAGACALACGEVGAACASIASHPYKSGQGTGQLTYCKNGWPSYTCTYTFPSGEGCVGNHVVGKWLWYCLYPGGK
jgi:hypothetical protein